MAEQDQGPKIHIDSDWKAQAQAEKERLKQSAPPAGAKPGPSGGRAGAGGVPPASFETLVSTMATQALFALGAFPDPRTGRHIAHLELARHQIDMLSVIEQKTKGNLSPEEANLLTTTLYELRNRYIQIATAARSQGGA